MMKETYIIDAVRTAIGSFGGGLSQVRADDLAAIPIRELLKRNPNLDPNLVDDVILGCHNQAGEDNRNVARMALLLAGLPYTVPGETVNRLCSSGMSAVIHANRAIKAGDGEIFIAGGMEHMTRGPWVMSKSSKPFGNDSQLFDSSFGWRFVNPKMKDLYGIDAMGQTAENLVDIYKISRGDQDLFAYRSQQKAFEAQKLGYFVDEIVPVEWADKKGDVLTFEQDEFIKGNTTLEKLSSLKPAFRKEGGSVTAGNASGLNDGAAAMLLASELAVKNAGFVPKGRIISSAVVGVEPRIMGIGPVYASQKALERAGLTLDQMDILELNEAFASQSLACMHELGIDAQKVNVNGGAIALGHPLGASGARISTTLLHEMKKRKARYGVATMCIGVGQGAAIVYELVAEDEN